MDFVNSRKTRKIHVSFTKIYIVHKQLNNLFIHFFLFLIISRYRLENSYLIENNNDTSTKTKNKSYLNVAYSIQRHAEAIQYVYGWTFIFPCNE